jgi:ABC-type transport system involved in multi-copper enzyme maturation permease subunit
MLPIAKLTMLQGLRDAKFLFLSCLVILAFVVNASVYSDSYSSSYAEWRESVQSNARELEGRLDNLQTFSAGYQKIYKAPAAAAFIADGGEGELPDTWTVNAFLNMDPERTVRGNKMLPLLGRFDWGFIVGTLMTLLAFLVSFDAVCGEKRDGTLKQVFACPVSRIELFAGKYAGFLAILLFVLSVGMAANLLILALLGAIPLAEGVLWAVAWAFVLSALCLSLALLAGILISSLVHHPPVAMVVLLVVWILITVAVPGTARLFGEQIVSVKSQYQVTSEADAAQRAVLDSAPENLRMPKDNDPFNKDVPLRADMWRRFIAAAQRVWDESNEAKLRQFEIVNTIASISPSGLLNSSLQEVVATGAPGFRALLNAARRFQQQLYDFAANKDATDPESPHILYALYDSADRGVFSMKPVEPNTYPRAEDLWSAGGLPREQGRPIWQLIVFIILNLNMALAAFIALSRYDVR